MRIKLKNGRLAAHDALDRDAAGDEYGERLDALQVIKDKHGGTLADASGDETAEVRKLLKETEALGTHIDYLDAGGEPKDHSTHHPVPGSGGASGRTRGGKMEAPRDRGWKSGHWSGPFSRAVKDLTPSGAVTVPSLTDGIVRIEDRPARLLDVIPTTQLGPSDQFAYLQETERTHAAAETAPGALKPTSTYSVAKVEDRTRTVAHISEPVRRQDLDDAELLRLYVEGALRAGVMLRLDGQIINGTGVGENLTGLAATSGIQVQPFATDFLTTARKALTLLQDVELPGGVFVLSTAMWEALELLTTGDDEHYALDRRGDRLPVSRAQQRLWDQPVIVTSALSGDNAYLVDFAGSTRLYERESVRVDWSEAPEGSVAGESAFKSNELIFRAEGRFGFAVLRPDGVVQFDTTV